MASTFNDKRRSLILGAGAIAITFSKTSSGATTASLMPSGRQQYFVPGTTQPLAGGKLYTFDVGTSTPKPTYLDASGTMPNPNPVTLDATGSARIYWTGRYKVVLKDASGKTVYAIDDYADYMTQVEDPARPSAPAEANRVKGEAEALRMTDYAALRAYKGPQTSVYITGYAIGKAPSGIAGMFTRDDRDTTTADNGGWCITDAQGRRWKRLMNGSTVNPLWFGAIDDWNGNTGTDNADAINKAIASFPAQGSPTWQSWALELTPTGAGRGYYVGKTIFIKNQQFGRLIGKGASLIGNFDGPVLQVGDMSGKNDVLWFHIEGLKVVQNSTGAHARAVVMQHAYSCTLDKCYLYGGQYALVLDGNANQVSGCTFRHAATANVSCAGGANNETNAFISCSNELSLGIGYDLNVNSGLGGFTQIIGGYCERNATANIRVRNNQKFLITGVYFNLQNGAAGIRLDGTVGPAFPAGYGTVQNCRVLGVTSGGVPKFIEQASASSINCAYSRNELEPGSKCDMYGATSYCINLDRRRKMVDVRNAVDFAEADTKGIPDKWTRQGTGAVSTGAAISPYGGSSVTVTPANQYIYQDIRVPSNALLRVSAYARTTGSDARIELWPATMTEALGMARTTSATPQRIETYIPAYKLAGATIVRLLLRTRDAGTATFSDIEIEDMTN